MASSMAMRLTVAFAGEDCAFSRAASLIGLLRPALRSNYWRSGLPLVAVAQAKHRAISIKLVLVNRDVAALGAGRNSGIQAYFHSCSPAAQYCKLRKNSEYW
jgi:hypothetical protein